MAHAVEARLRCAVLPGPRDLVERIGIEEGLLKACISEARSVRRSHRRRLASGKPDQAKRARALHHVSPTHAFLSTMPAGNF
jgi:hypothetical protein